MHNVLTWTSLETVTFLRGRALYTDQASMRLPPRLTAQLP